MVMKQMDKRITVGAIALLVACVLVAAAVVAATYFGSTTDEVAPIGASEGEATEPEAASAEASVRIDPEQPYAKLKDGQVKSVYFNLDGFDPYALGGRLLEDCLALLRRLRIYAEPLEGFDGSDFPGSYEFREDQLTVTLEDGSSFTVAPYGKTADGDVVIYIDGQAFAAKTKDLVYELERICERCAESLRNGGDGYTFVNEEGSMVDLFYVTELSGRDWPSDSRGVTVETLEFTDSGDGTGTYTYVITTTDGQ